MPLSPSEVSDVQLIEQIKVKNDSSALMELVNRHTGIYVSMINNYTYIPNVERSDIIEHRYSNIYKYAMDYDPSHKMKFSSYVGQRAKYECQTIISSRALITSEEEVTERTAMVFDSSVEDRDDVNFLIERAKKTPDKRFFEIFKRRHLVDEAETFSEIGKVLHLSHEGVIRIYKKNMKVLKREIK